MNDPLTKELTHALMHDRKISRRWKNIRFFIWIFILLLYAILIFGPSTSSFSKKDEHKPYVSLLRLKGVIMAGNNFSARRVVPQLIKAFSDKKSKGVVLVINSPGGSPVQSAIIHDKIMQLKKQYKKKVVVIGQDALASGAYLVATAADKIYVNKDTLTGSIGVIMGGFGFTDAIEKLGITRRVFIAGKNKDRLDPFKPMTEKDKQKIQSVLDQVHQNFVQYVEQGRKGRLHGNPAELFSGDFWTGEQAVKLGLVDGTGNTWTVLKKEFGVKHYKSYSVRSSFWQTLFKDVSTQLNIGLLSQHTQLEAVMQ